MDAELSSIAEHQNDYWSRSNQIHYHMFCFLLFQGQFCDYCNAADPNKAHPITNAIDGTERWWQSPSLSLGLKYDEIDVTLELGQVSVWVLLFLLLTYLLLEGLYFCTSYIVASSVYIYCCTPVPHACVWFQMFQG